MENRRKNFWTFICGVFQVFGGLIGLGRLLLGNFSRAAFHFCLTIFSGFLIGLPMVFNMLVEEEGPIVNILLNGTIPLSVLTVLGFILLIANLVLSVLDGVFLITKGMKKFNFGLSFVSAIGIHILMIAMLFGTVAVVIDIQYYSAIMMPDDMPTSFSDEDEVWEQNYYFEDDKLVYIITPTQDFDLLVIEIYTNESGYEYVDHGKLTKLKAGKEYTITFDITQSEFTSNNYIIETTTFIY